MLDKDNRIAEKLMSHRGHILECVSYGEWDDPADVCIECMDCNELLVSAEDFNEPPTEKRKVYGYFFFTAEDEDMPDGIELSDVTHTDLTLEPLEAYRQNVAAFQSQFDDQEAYVDQWGVIHIVTAHEDRPFAYYFEVIDDCWEDVLGSMGQFLDDSENKDMPEEIRKGFYNIYCIADRKDMPPKNTDVLLKFEHNYAVGSFDGDTWVINSGDNWCTPVLEDDELPITWQPLPEA